MPSRVESYGGPIRGEFRLATENGATVNRRRVLWFDRDIDGQWLVWASEDRGVHAFPEAESPIEVGALVIRDPAVAAFLDQLGELLLEPGQFAHEPVVGE